MVPGREERDQCVENVFPHTGPDRGLETAAAPYHRFPYPAYSTWANSGTLYHLTG